MRVVWCTVVSFVSSSCAGISVELEVRKDGFVDEACFTSTEECGSMYSLKDDSHEDWYYIIQPSSSSNTVVRPANIFDDVPSQLSGM